MDRSEVGLLVVVPVMMLSCFLLVIFVNSGSIFFIPDIWFFRLIIQIVVGLITFGGAITFFVYKEIERRISEIKSQREKVTQYEKIKSQRERPEISTEILVTQYERWISEYSDREKKVLDYVCIAIFLFIVLVSLSFGYIYVPVKEEEIIKGVIGCCIVILLLGLGTACLILIPRALLKPMPKGS